MAQCRFPGLAISNATIFIYFSNKIYGSIFVKQHSETVMVWNCQTADCSLRKKILSFIIIFGTLLFPTDWAGEVTARLAMHTGVPVDGRWRRVHTRDVREWLSCNILSPPIPISSFPFPITFPWFLRFNSHSCPVTKIYPNSLPFPSPSLTNERHLSLKDQTRINVQNANTRLSYLQNFNSESHIVTYR